MFRAQLCKCGVNKITALYQPLTNVAEMMSSPMMNGLWKKKFCQAKRGKQVKKLHNCHWKQSNVLWLNWWTRHAKTSSCWVLMNFGLDHGNTTCMCALKRIPHRLQHWYLWISQKTILVHFIVKMKCRATTRVRNKSQSTLLWHIPWCQWASHENRRNICY